jgi:hypothetical protein
VLRFTLVLVAACGTTADDYWDDTVPDDVTDALAATSARVAITAGETKHAELVDVVPVGRSEDGAERRVALRLGPAELPRLARGDRLITPAELEVTTRCDVGQIAPGCDYNPNVRAQLILAGDPADTHARGGASKALSDAETISCTKADHHCKLVFMPSVELGGLPCIDAGTCHVNLVVWAWHPDARAGGADKLLVGSNDGNYLDNGVVEGDQARLMAVRERGVTAGDRAARESSGGGTITMPLDARSVLVYSHELKPGGTLRAGEQFVVEAKVVTAASDRARFSTQMFLTKDPRATDGNGLDKITPGEITEHNGINCTRGASPCVTRRVAVFRVTEDIAGPVYVNLIARSEVPGGGSANVVVRRGDGWIRSVRYAATLGQ